MNPNHQLYQNEFPLNSIETQIGLRFITDNLEDEKNFLYSN